MITNYNLPNFSWSKISTGISHQLAIRSDGALFTWGGNATGQLGLSDVLHRSSPVQIGTSSWTQVAAGDDSSYAVRSDGALFAWGNNTVGQLGIYTATNRSSPVQLGTSSWSQINAGRSHVLGTLINGALFAWGLNNAGQLGDGSIGNKSSPVLINSINPNGYYSVWMNGGTSGDLLSFASSATAYNLSSASWTVEFWVNPQLTSFSDGENRLLMGGTNSQNTGWVLGILSTSAFFFGIPIGGATGISTAANGVTYNTWQHVAFVRTGGNAYIYVNGLLKAGPVANTLPVSGTIAFKIGYDAVATVSTQYRGFVSNVRINTTTAIYTSNFTPPTSPLTAVSGTTVLTCQSNAFTENAAKITVTRSGSPATSTQNPFNLVGPFISYTQISAGVSHSVAIQNNGLLSTWGLNTSGQLGDGTAINKSNPVQIVSTSNGYYSTYFNGSTDYLTATTGDLGSGDFTVEYWVYYTSFYNYITNASTTRGSTGWSAGSQAAAQIVWYSSTAEKVRGTTAMVANTWNHVAFVRSSGTLKGYLNGIQDGTFNTETTNFTNNSFAIGRLQNATPGEYFTGYMSNVRITKGQALYTTNFTPSTIPFTVISQGATATNVSLLSCQSSVFRDESTNTLTVTPNGTPTNRIFNPFQTTNGYFSASFNGSTDKLTLASNAVFSLSAEFTIECWIYWNGTTTFYQNFIGSNNGSFTGNASFFRVWGSGFGTTTIERKIGIGNPTHDGISTVYSANEIRPFTWYHVATTRDSSNIIRVFINGTLEGTGSTDTSVYDFGLGGTCIGNSGWDGANGWYSGYISNLRVVKGQALYTSSFTAPTTPLTTTSQGATAANVSLLTCQSNSFIDNSTNNFTITKTSNPILNGFVPFGITGFSYTQVSAGNTFSGGLLDSGALMMWGVNTGGRLGDKTVISKSAPVQIGLSSYTQVALTQSATAVITNNGTLFTWGFNNTGNFADGSVLTAYRSSPVQVGTNTSWQTLSGSKLNGTNLAEWNNTLLAWGINTTGQLGDLTVNQLTTPNVVLSSNVRAPIQIGTSNWSQVSAGYSHSLAIASNNLLFGWGSYAAGLYSAYFYNSVSAGGTHAVIVRNDGGLFAWGTNASGQLGDLSTVTKSSPVQIGTSSWSQVFAGFDSTYALDNTSRLWAWGNNNVGQIGDTTLYNKSSPVLIGLTPTNGYYSVQFNGSSDYLVFNGSSALAFSTNLFTVEFWVCLTSISGTRTVIDARPTATAVPVGFEFLTGGYPSWYNGASNTSTVAITANTWNHIAFVREGTGTNQAKIYINGTLAYTFTDSTNYGTMNTSSRICAGLSNVNYVEGYVSNIRIVKSQALYTTNFTPSTTPLTTTSQGATAANVSLLTCQSNSFIDNSNNNFAITRNGTPYPNATNPFGYNGTNSSWIQVSAGSSFTVGIKSDNTLWGWGLNTGGQLGDASVLNKSSPVLLGSIGETGYNSVAFGAGASDYIYASYNTALTFGSGAFTVECWVYLTRASNANAMIGGIWDGSSTTPQSWVWYVNVSGTIGFAIDVATTDTVVLTSSVALLNFVWTHIAVTRSGNTWYLFMNGVQTATATNSSSISAGTAPLYIGSYQNKTAGDTTWNGYISNFRVTKGQALYTTTFTPSTTPLTTTSQGATAGNVSLLTCQSSRFIDNSNNLFAITVSGSASISSINPFGYNSNNASYTQVSAGNNHTLAVKPDQSLFVWGNNANGQFGDNSVVSRSSPVQISTILNESDETAYLTYASQTVTSWAQLSGGTSHTIGLKTDGSLWTWGDNTQGQLGLNTVIGYSSPVKVGTSSWTSIIAGAQHSLAVRSDGLLFAWGSNTTGQLGDNTVVHRSSPVQVGSFSYTSVGAGTSSSFGIKSDTSLYGWGGNTSALLGLTDTVHRSSPVQLGSLADGYFSNYFSNTFSLTTPTSTNFALGAGAFTIEMWFYLTQTTTGSIVLALLDSGSGYYPWIRFGDTTYGSKLQFALNPSSSSTIYSTATTSTSALSTWYHVALTRDGSGVLRAFLNGTQQSLGTGLNPGTYPVTSWTDTTNVGSSNSYMTIGDPNEVVYTTGGTYTWVCPSNVTSVNVVCIGGGGGGNSGGGGGLGWKNNISVTPGQSYTVVVGSGGSGGQAGGNSYFINQTTVAGLGGSSGAGAAGGGYVGDGGGNGGAGGGGYYGGAAGGAGGYAGNGGKGGNEIGGFDRGADGSAGSGGGGGGGASAGGADNTYGGGGGGVSVYGQRSNGAGGAGVFLGSGGAGYGGSGGNNGSGPSGGVYGGGGAANRFGGNPQPGGVGAVRIMWGRTQSAFPTTAVDGASNTATPGTANFYISNFRFVKGSALYTGNFVVPTSPLTAVSGTQLLTAQSVTLKDNSTNNYTLYTNNTADQIYVTGTQPFASAGLSNFSNVTSVSAGDAHTIVLSNNSLFTAGLNSAGQLGINASTASRVYFAILDNQSWNIVSAGASFSAAIKTNGTLWVWGQNTTGQIGDSTVITRSSPVQLGTSSWVAVSAGLSSTIGVTVDRRLFAWGGNGSGQLGLIDIVHRSSPVQVGTSSWNLVSENNGQLSGAININGRLYQWGLNSSGAVGALLNTASFSSPVFIPSVNPSITQISAGLSTSAVVRTDGKLLIWGDNSVGQLGQLDLLHRSNPVQVGTSSWAQIDAGASFTLGTLINNNLYAWGNNSYGQLGINTITPRSSPTQVGTAGFGIVSIPKQNPTGGYVLGLTYGSNILNNWGYNTQGQLGLSDTANRSSPVQLGSETSYFSGPTAISTITQIGAGTYGSVSAGNNYSLATGTNSILYTWGKPPVGVLQGSPAMVGTGFSAINISAGISSTGFVRKGT